jgi:hypothetical protein
MEGNIQVLDHLSDAEIVRGRDEVAALEEMLWVDEHFLPVCAAPQAPGRSV